MRGGVCIGTLQEDKRLFGASGKLLFRKHLTYLEILNA